jgi:hypothetical protein
MTGTIVIPWSVFAASPAPAAENKRIRERWILLTRRGKPVARVVPARTSHHILGAGAHDPNINCDVLAQDKWWKPLPEEEEHAWYE